MADVLQEQGLIMLMAYQDGCVYLGKGMQQVTISRDFIESVYQVLEKNIRESSASLSDPSRIGKQSQNA